MRFDHPIFQAPPWRVPGRSTFLQEALALHRRGAIAEAAAQYAEALRADPHNADVHYYLGMLACQQGKFAEGADRAGQALALDPRHARAKVLLGRARTALGQHDEALANFDGAIALAPDLAQAHGCRADLLAHLGRNAEAIDGYDRALALAPDVIEDVYNRGVALAAVGRHGDAIASFERVIADRPEFHEAYLRRAKSLSDLGRHAEALQGVERLLADSPGLAQGWLARANLLGKLKQYEPALAAFDRALQLQPDLAEAWLARGNMLAEAARHDDAGAAYDRALALKPSLAEAWLGRGNILARSRSAVDAALAAYDRALILNPSLAEAWLGRANGLANARRFEEALAAHDKTLALKSELADAWFGRGNVLFECKRFDVALVAYDRALALRPDFAEAWLGRGIGCFFLRRYGDALFALDKALAVKPEIDYATSLRFHLKQQICDWSNFDAEAADLLAKVRLGTTLSYPFAIIAAPFSAADQLACARAYSAVQSTFVRPRRSEIYNHDRVRVAYLSADFDEHPTTALAAGLFERHDRSRFEVTGISFGPARNTAMRRRFKGAFERFVDAEHKSSEEIANLMRELEIDIAVDLMGFTMNNRFEILTRRPAPIQVSYLGYIGTTGSECIDYVIGDRIALPFEQQPFYSEKIVHLPDCFLVTDDRQEIAPHIPSRPKAGLPQEGFVFCSFNSSYKITPQIFERWMQLLRAVSGSVLWLAHSNAEMVGNLKREAARSGVAPERIIFASRMALSEHLARQKLADLYLDTVPYNAGATAAAALWSGVPLLTVVGETFVGRMAASMLHAVGLSELVSRNLDDYEALAVKLAGDPHLLAEMRCKLGNNLRRLPLFDTDRFRRGIERAYLSMVETARRRGLPQNFSISAT